MKKFHTKEEQNNELGQNHGFTSKSRIYFNIISLAQNHKL
jgi:hypothetical protein